MDDGRIAVMLPGLDGTGKLFDRVVRRCPRWIHPLVVPYPGDEILDYPQLESFVRERLPRDKPFIIVAESFSGPVAVRIASRPPANLAGVVLAASFVTPSARAVWRYLPWRTLFRFPAPVQVLRRVLLASDSALLGEMREAIRSVSPRVLAARVRSTLSIDARAELARVTCPLLYIRARRDRVVPLRCLRDILSVREDVVVESLDAPHPVLQHEPDAAWKLIDRFARACS
jgi:pimeloyl-ACP methyl ester carboxylesterase